MIDMHRRASLSLLLMVLMTASSFVVLAAPSASAGPDLPSESASDAEAVNSDWARVVMLTASLTPEERLSADLADKIKTGTGTFRVHLIIVDREAVNEYMAAHSLPIVKGVEIPGMPTTRLLELSSADIAGLAANPGVMRIFEYEAPQYDKSEALAGDPEEKIDVAPPEVEDLDVDYLHGAWDAWMDGFTGDGVKIAVIDTGFDMGHPDLQGQQARYATGGPYDGWPIAYDDAAADAWSGGEAGGWVSDTSWTSWDMGGWVDFNGQPYMISGIPFVSMSGLYHLGLHPDQHLMAIWGAPVAVLVVDANVPGVYDTVYVDIMSDFDFSDDKPCRMYDEISYYDGWDAGSETWNWGWNSGDGYADLSGGMVYWISDGANVYPGSDWLYGAGWVPASGNAVAFMGEFNFRDSHGTMTASAALASGATMWGQLAGMAPDASLICIPFTGDMVSSWLFAEWGADQTPGTGDEANIVSNSYGWSETAIEAGYTIYDELTSFISLGLGDSLWMWSAGNGGPGYGTSHSPTDFTSVHVGAGTTMQYRSLLGMEYDYDYAKWGDVIPFSGSGPARNGKLNAEIVASGAYSLEPAPLNWYGYLGDLGDGSTHFQMGSGTSHATPTVAGGAALGYQAFYDYNGGWPSVDYAKAKLMAAADDMHFDPLKQGAGWLNAYTYVMLMGGWDDGVDTLAYMNEPVLTKAALYPGFVYGSAYESFANLLLPGQWDDTHILSTSNYNFGWDYDVNVTGKMLMRTGSDTIVTVTPDAYDVFLDITSYVPANTDLLKVTMWMSMDEFDPGLDYASDVAYWLELHDWYDSNMDGMMNVTDADLDGYIEPDQGEWELYRYTVDGSDCNYNQVMIKDPIDRTTHGLIARLRASPYYPYGAAGVTLHVQLDYYELQAFPWLSFRMLGDTVWLPSLDFTAFASSTMDWEVNVSIPADAPVGTYAAAIYIDDGSRVQNFPVVINVAAPDWSFEFGGPSYFDTPYNNDIVGVADKGWRFEVGDWRLFYAMPAAAPPSNNANLIVTVNWTELPTDVNVHVLAPSWATYPTFNEPFAPDIVMTSIAGSDEKYLGGGTFGSYTNTGGPKEVISAAMGSWFSGGYGPIAIVTRCPVMSGNASHDTITGYTTWLTMNGYDPGYIGLDVYQPGGNLPEGNVSAWYDITVDGPVEARGGGIGPLVEENFWSEPIYQDVVGGNFDEAVANAMYTRGYWVEDSSLLAIQTSEVWDAPDIDLGLWYDANMNGVADMTEPYWLSGTSGSDEFIQVEDPADGLWLIKVLGYAVTGSPGYFDLRVITGVDGYILATDLESPVSSGVHSFNVSYKVPAVPGYYFGIATFGFMGSDDMFAIFVEIWVYDFGAPEIQNVVPADGSALPTSSLDVSFYANDEVWPIATGINWGSLWVRLDGTIDLLQWSDWWVDDKNVTIQFPLALDEGNHFLEIQVADNWWNYAYWSGTFEVNSEVEELTALMVNPDDFNWIPDGATVSWTEVGVVGFTEPYAVVYVINEDLWYSTSSGDSGLFNLWNITLKEGVNTLTVLVINNAGVEREAKLSVTSDSLCMLWVADVEPITSNPALDLSGWTDVGAIVTIDGVPATVEPDGTWSGSATLVEGPNSVSVVATDALGNSKLITVSVELDQTPPALVVLGPSDGSNTSQPSVVVWGTTEAGATVWVNGVVASDGSADWSATVVLSEGWNNIAIVTEDAVGNGNSTALSVEYIPPDYVTPEELAAVQAELTDLIENVTDALIENVSDLQGQLDDLAAALAENVTALQNQIDGAIDDILGLQASLAENITALQDQIDAVVADIAALEASLAASVAALENADDALAADLLAQVEMLEDAIEENTTALNALIDTLETQMGELEDDMQSQIDDLEQSMTDDVNQVEEKADDTDAFASMLMYLTLVLFIIAIVLIGVIWFIMNRKIGGGSSGGGHSMEEVQEPPSEVEKEFEALEKEIKQDEL